MESNNEHETISQKIPWLKNDIEIGSGDQIRIIIELENGAPIYNAHTNKWKLMDINIDELDFNDRNKYYGAIVTFEKIIFPKSNNSGYVFVENTVDYFECSKDDIPSKCTEDNQKQDEKQDEKIPYVKGEKKDYSPQNATWMGSRKSLGLDSDKIKDINSSKF